MSSNPSTLGLGGVSNLRAIFEHKASDEQSISPPSRGRSPAHSDASISGRPVSKVRASFVAVERPGDSGEGQLWGLRKASDVTTMSDTNHESQGVPLVDEVGKIEDSHSQSNGVSTGSETRQESATKETSQGGLGNILKGSAFEASPPTSRSNRDGGAPKASPTSPTSSKKSSATSKMNGKSASGVQPHSIGSRIKEAVSLGRNEPPPKVKLNTTKDAKPIKPPPTRQAPPAKLASKSPTSPKTSRTPVSPSFGGPFTRGSSAKPTAVTESAKDAKLPEKGKQASTLPREAGRASAHKASPPATRNAQPLTRPGGVNNDPKADSPEAKARPARVSTSAAAAPTAASAAKTGNSTSTGRKPTVTKRDRPPAKATASAAPPPKRTRASLTAQTNEADKAKPRTSIGSKAPEEGFLARMMRPTASSAQKAHEKATPTSPPRTKRTAPLHAAKAKARRSLTISEEDKENSHRGQPGTHHSPSATDSQHNAMDSDKTGTSPLKDITPVAEPGEAAEEAKLGTEEPSAA